MPTYLYECSIHGEFEEYHSMSLKLEHCPHCEKENVVSEVKRLINSTSVGVVELTGQELIDKVKADTQKLKKDMGKSEKIYSNMLGDAQYQKLQTQMDKQKRK